MDCEHSAKMMTDLLSGELDAAAKRELMAHIDSCEPCRKDFAELSKLWTFTESALKSAKLSESLAPENYKAILNAAKPRVPWYSGLFSGMDANMDIFSASALRVPLVQIAICSLIIVVPVSGLLLYSLDSFTMSCRNEAFEPMVQDGKKTFSMSMRKDASTFVASAGLAAGAAVAGEDKCSPAPPVPADGSRIAYDSIVVNEASPSIAALEMSGVNALLKKSYAGSAKSKAKAVAIDDASSPSAPLPKLPAEWKDRSAGDQMVHYENLMKKDKAAVPQERDLKGGKAEMGEVRLQAAAPSRVRSDADYEMQDRQAATVRNFEADLKLWDMNTAKDAAKFLKDRGVDIPVGNLRIVRRNGKGVLSITAPPTQMDELEDIFDDLKIREEERLKVRDGIPMLDTSLKPVSTFSLDVDTASYTAARKLILDGRRPDPESVRPEEFINYFDYHYKSPEGSAVLSVQLEAAPSPFRPGDIAFRVGVQSRKLGPDAKRPSSFTVLVDSSGSMAQRNRLDLVKSSLRLFVGQLKASDTVSLISCGPEPEILLDHVPAEAAAPVERAIGRLSTGGSTDLERGIVAAYRLALKNYRPGAFNRVVVFTDGIGGLGSKSADGILGQVESARAKGVGNTIVGVGGDGDDKLLESLADKGDGQYIFLDSEEEAQEVFAGQFAAKFRELAKDVKIQVEFNPALVARYRQVGYQNRQLSKDEFRDDKVDAGELGAGQSATALYALRLAKGKAAEELRQTPLATVRVRYKLPDTLEVQEREFTILPSDIKRSFADAGGNFKLACAIAEFAERLRYPDTPGIANPGAIKDVLRDVMGGVYSDDAKVKEAATLLDAVK